MVNPNQLVLGILLACAVFTAQTGVAETLTYKEGNKWVASEDNKPLQALMEKARGGQTRFKVGLPAEGRPLAARRLAIVRDILAREARKAVILEESLLTAPPNTLTIQ